MATPLRVLMLEDQPTDAELILYELRRAGFAPVWERVETEAEYLAHLDQPLDVILADYHLPQFDALRALPRTTSLVTPFIANNGAVGCAEGDDRVVAFSPDNCSVTVLDVEDGRLRLVRRGVERATQVL